MIYILNSYTSIKLIFIHSNVDKDIKQPSLLIMSMNVKSDFPFSNWTDFYMAMTESLNTEFFSETYPKYGSVTDEFGSNEVDYRIVKDFLEKGLSAQEGLEGLISAVMDGSRYAKDSRSNIHKMVSLLMDKGACPDMTKLLGLRYEPVWSNFEDEIQDAVSRGILLEIIEKKIIEKKMSLPVKSLVDIEAMYWEDIPDTTEYNMAVKMAIKYEMKRRAM